MKRGLIALLAGFLVGLAACSSAQPSVTPAPASGAGEGFAVRENWRSTVLVERDDSIVLTMPSGASQVQRYHREAAFTLAVGLAGNVTIQLDSVKTTPASAGDVSAPNGAVWTGHLGDPAIAALRAGSGSTAIGELTSVVRHLLPRLPAVGAVPKSVWRDSATGSTSTDIFKVTERRTAAWSAGALAGSPGARELPIRVSEDFEQIGEGSRDYRRITVTSQGRRTGTYYLESDGRVRSAQLTDSSAMSIGVPDLKEVMSGTRVTRTEIRFIAVRGER